MGKILNFIFIILLVMALVLFAVYYALFSIEEEKEFGGFQEITGTVQNFEVHHSQKSYKFNHAKTTEEYDDEFFSYLESIQKSRDETFNRGRVFLEEN